MVTANYKAVIDDYDDSEVFASFQGLSWEEAHAPLHQEDASFSTGTNNNKKRMRRLRDSLPIQTVEEKWHAAKVWWHYREEWPQRSALHRGFVMLNILSIASCFRLIMAQLTPLLLRAPISSALEVFLRIYISMYCVIFIIAELELRIPVIWKTNDGFLRSFLPRGLSFTFIALVGEFEGTFDEKIEDYKHSKESPDSLPGPGLFLAILVQVSSWLLMAAGVIYILLGLWCCPHMQKKRDECRVEYRSEVSSFLRRMKDKNAKLQQGQGSRRRSGSCDFGDNAVSATLSRTSSCDFG
mmetsp:Transcript_18071/g.30017  ORF Transcript_18071/g.30017 Transcript_18071/m.30017 type:complete len:297 (-) Transcript_18071:563-1453(-)